MACEGPATHDRTHLNFLSGRESGNRTNRHNRPQFITSINLLSRCYVCFMNMELGVDSKPKEHPSARICRQLAPPAAGRRHREWIAVDDKLWQRLFAGHRNAIGATDFHRRHHVALARSMCTSNALDVADGGAISFTDRSLA